MTLTVNAKLRDHPLLSLVRPAQTNPRMASLKALEQSLRRSPAGFPKVMLKLGSHGMGSIEFRIVLTLVRVSVATKLSSWRVPESILLALV